MAGTAASAASVMGACKYGQVPISTASISGSATSSSHRPYVLGIPNSAAAAAVDCGRELHTPIIFTSRQPRNPGTCRARQLPPSPTIPTRIVFPAMWRIVSIVNHFRRPPGQAVGRRRHGCPSDRSSRPYPPSLRSPAEKLLQHSAVSRALGLEKRPQVPQRVAFGLRDRWIAACKQGHRLGLRSHLTWPWCPPSARPWTSGRRTRGSARPRPGSGP